MAKGDSFGQTSPLTYLLGTILVTSVLGAVFYSSPYGAWVVSVIMFFFGG